MNIGKPERETQNRVIALFRDELRYRFLGDRADRPNNSNIEEDPLTGGIRLNTELAKKPRECLEYIVVHEMVHLLAPTHNRRFVALMEQFMPKWQFCGEELNRLPVHHERWRY